MLPCRISLLATHVFVHLRHGQTLAASRSDSSPVRSGWTWPHCMPRGHHCSIATMTTLRCYHLSRTFKTPWLPLWRSKVVYVPNLPRILGHHSPALLFVLFFSLFRFYGTEEEGAKYELPQTCSRIYSIPSPFTYCPSSTRNRRKYSSGSGARDCATGTSRYP